MDALGKWMGAADPCKGQIGEDSWNLAGKFRAKPLKTMAIICTCQFPASWNE
jgi:hypothetical protein